MDARFQYGVGAVGRFGELVAMLLSLRDVKADAATGTAEYALVVLGVARWCATGTWSGGATRPTTRPSRSPFSPSTCDRNRLRKDSGPHFRRT